MSFVKKNYWNYKYRGDEQWLARERKCHAMVAGSWSALAGAKWSLDKDRIIRAADKCIRFCSSEQRLERMIHAVADQQSEIFWPVWLKHWPCTDFCRDWHRHLPSIFDKHGSAWPYMSDEAKARFDDLPDMVTVYRGCHELLKDGVSWTTNRKVAEYFATGGRCGRPSRPVIVTGRFCKQSPNFYYCNDTWSEIEIVCAPAIEKVEPYTGPWPGDPNFSTPWASRKRGGGMNRADFRRMTSK